MEIALWTQDIRHVPGADNEASDWMSRRPDYKPRDKNTPLGTEHQLPTDVLEILQNTDLSMEEKKNAWRRSAPTRPTSWGDRTRGDGK